MSQPLPKVLLANEAGIGRGHIVKLLGVAQALGPGLSFAAGLARRKHADELAVLDAEILQAPVMGYTPEAVANPALEGNATWGDYLFAMGLAREAHVRHALDWWTRTIVAQDASILVADYAPLAMLAARGLKAQGWAIEIISAGTGYAVPPADLPAFPRLLPDYSRVVHQEADVLAMLNRVAAEFHIDPLPSLPALYQADAPLPSTFPFLDPYRALRPASDLLPPQVNTAKALADTGDEVFVYFSTSELNDPAVVAALADLPLPRRAFLPGADAATAAHLAASGVNVTTKPLPIAEITARSRLILHSAQHGIICLAALSGLPQVAIPQHLEQLFHGRRAGQQGILDLLDGRERSAAALTDLLLSSYHDRGLQSRTRDFARALRADHPEDANAVLRQRLAPVLARATQSLR